ncbi:MAG: AraC family transcriptional regulator, partial [Bacteroidales bacterium]|nr:AraC family transcriptional regulator [Bacteroidales bacterium]
MAGMAGHITETVHIKNMVCNCCKFLLKEKFEASGITVHEITLGKAKISYDKSVISYKKINSILNRYGFSLLENREDKLVGEIKIAVIELIHHLNNVNSIVRKSDYLVEKLGFSYPHLSKIFSEHENGTLEKYIILQKIERIKHLLKEEDYSLSEIAYMMDYSSVQYLSNQFKKITGVTVSQFRAGSEISMKGIDEI